MGMNFEHFAQYVDFGLGLLLIARLLALRLHKVYTIFSYFLIADLLGSILWIVRSIPGSPLRLLDYRLIWLSDRILVWGLLLWTVVALLEAVLVQYPGIVNMSRKVLHYCFLGSIGIAALSALPEYSASEGGQAATWQDHALVAGLVAERVVFSIALLAILTLMTFLLWFPVRIPRNLVIFTTGFLVYFTVMNAVLLARSFWSHDLMEFASITGSLIAAICFAYWGLFISKTGELATATLHLVREPRQQERLMERLELLNDSLLRAARR